MEKSTNSFVLFFTDKDFRKSKIQYLKFRISLLPGIRHILSWIFAFRYAMKTKDLSPWDQHVAKMNLERASRKTIFICALIRLYGCIAAEEEYRNTEGFLTTKKEVLECEYWKDVPELSDFKNWIENITPEERDAERVLNVLRKYNTPE
ncbi:MAG: hypothetical protein IJW20_01705 [Clostridia bacterium]|nr:hypothetical protein [Clostridia bacterium]